jgi:hypothetical protein
MNAHNILPPLLTARGTIEHHVLPPLRIARGRAGEGANLILPSLTKIVTTQSSLTATRYAAMRSLLHLTSKRIAIALLAVAPSIALAFDSGSTGADGAFSPTVNTIVQLPPNGIFNFTTVNVPTGVTVKFLRNVTNTPVTILASGNVTIAGTIDVSGTAGAATGAAGDGNLGDDGVPGKGGPGGFDGGRGGTVAFGAASGAGLGPGGGSSVTLCNNLPAGGAGGGFAAVGSVNGCGTGGSPYATTLLLPLIGGSGGGGGGGGSQMGASGGGGGGGALVVASSATINVAGSVLATGGQGGSSAGTGVGGGGGGGSGGAIRIVATTISGNGTISANGGAGGAGVNNVAWGGGGGSIGRIRLEAENITRTSDTSPSYSFGTPGTVFVSGSPTLAITSIGGVAVPGNPTGIADVSLPAGTANPVPVVVTTSNVPVGNMVKVTVTPATGAISNVNSSVLAGSTASATATAQVTLPSGPSTLQAQLSYTLVASLGDALRHYAGNERVARVELTAALGGTSRVKLITVTGKEFEAPPEALHIAALGG